MAKGVAGCRRSWRRSAASVILSLLVGLTLGPDRAFVRGLKLGGVYDANTDPENEAKIALDAAAIKETDDLEIKKNIYLNGQNSQYQDPQSLELINRSLASLSLKALEVMKDDDWYNVYRYSFGYIGNKDENEQQGNFDEQPIEHYANTVVIDLFNLAEEDIETEAAVVMNVWMMVAHHLQEAERQCKSSKGGNSLDGEASLDVSAAYYIGWGQVQGDNDKGDLLYNLAENAGARFGKDEGETLANKNIIGLMNRIKYEIITAGKCPTDFLKFRSLVRQIIAQMTVPLVQNLIHYMSEGKTDKMELYALALSPQISACDTAGYNYILDKLVLNTYEPANFLEIVGRLQGLYSCFGITCEDVGAYQTDEVQQCNDNEVNSRTDLAGYPVVVSLTGRVRQAAYFDRDLLRMKNLMSMDALNAAKAVYAHGFNSIGSLADLSIKSFDIMKKDDWYNIYRYAFGFIGTQDEQEEAGNFDENPIEQYADTVVNDLFQLNREGIETEAAMVMNVWMTVAHYLQEAANKCRSGSADDVGPLLELATAYWVGWGQPKGDNANGRLLYHLTENSAVRFKTDGSGEGTEAAANAQIFTLLGDIKAEIVDAGKCPSDYPKFRSFVNEIVAQMTVPLVQNMIHYMAGNKAEKMELYALSIAPQIAACDHSGFVYLLDKLVLNTFDTNLFNEVVGRMQSLYTCLGLTCLDIGEYESEFGKVPLCDDNDVNSRTELAGYQLSSSVGKAAYYDRDLLRMRNLMSMDALAASKDTYQLGFNAERSLADLSLNSHDIMKDEEYYNVYLSSFKHIGTQDEDEDDGQFDDRPIEEYANTVVEDLYDLNKEGIETEAAMVMNVWMIVAHHLQEGARLCESGSQGDIVQQLDLAASFWIGSGQATGDNDDGRLLYHLTENAGFRFGKDSGNSVESDTNNRILAFMVQLKGLSCPSDYPTFRSTVNSIISLMNVPLVQNLIHYMAGNKQEKLELYALAITPQVAVCDPTEYEYFLEQLVLSSFSVNKFDDIVSRLQSVYPCLGITCSDVGAYNADSSRTVAQCADRGIKPSSLAGYQLRTDIQEVAYMDRDILRMKSLMGMKALKPAKDVYMYGFNAAQSLQKVATSTDRSVVPFEYSLFKGYFGGDADYADTMIMDAFGKRGIFEGASDEQVSEIVVRASQSMVMYMNALQELYSAESLCSSDKAAAAASWDRGAASLIGSIEGSESGGRANGRFIFALAKELCGYFQVCPTPGDVEVNEDLINALNQGAESISSGTCSGLVDPSASPLLSLLKVANVQGTLHFAAVNAAPSIPVGSLAGSVGSGHSLYSSIAPLIIDSTSGAVETNMKFDLQRKPVSDGAASVFTDIAKSLSSIGVDCEKIGVYRGIEGGDLCVLLGQDPVDIEPTPSTPAPTPANQVPTTPTSGDQPTPSPVNEVPFPLPGIGYQYTTGADDHAYIAYDIRDMQNSEAEISKNVYENGGNAAVKDAVGDGITLSLKTLSTGSRNRMGQSIFYNFYRYAFKDEPVFVENANSVTPDSSYGNTVVIKAYDVADDKALAADAAVVMTLFMEIVHQLELAVKFCDGSGNGERAIDIAVAFWVGTGQVKGDNDSGYLMYSVAEGAGARFGQDNGETAVNTKIISLFNEAKQLAGSCRSDQGDALRVVTQQILAQMNIPLIQNLIYYMNMADSEENDYENDIELYALSLVPQVAACNPSTFSYLKDELVDYDWEPNDIEDISIALQGSLSCFGVTCDDIGTLQSDIGQVVQPCVGFGLQPGQNMAGYSASTDATEIAKIDRDILQINITMQMEAFRAAEDIYMHGRNSKNGDTFMSLHQMATDLDAINSDAVGLNNPQKLFSDYFNSETISDYSISGTHVDGIIKESFSRSGRFVGAHKDQLTAVVYRALQSMVTLIYSLQHLILAVEKCMDPDSVANGRKLWDMGAATLIGSIEGPNKGGTDGGQLMFALAKEKCSLFDTCTTPTDANANAKLIAQLSGGSAALGDNECDNARGIVTDQIIPTLEISMIQSVLDYAAINSKLGAGSGEESLGAGFALTEALLPFVDNANETSALTLKTNMAFNRQSQPVPDGIDAVFDAVVGAISSMGVSCEAVGTYKGGPMQSVCRENHPGTDISLLNGGYVTTTYVKEQTNIALDIKAMEQALEGGFPDEAKSIYENGLNSIIYNKKGTKVGLRNLASFSTSAELTMRQEAIHNIMTYGLEDENGLYLGKNVASYADTIVGAAFGNTNVKTLASEAAVVLNLWGYVVHELNQMADNCKNKRLTDDDGVLSLDEAAAYYIGDRQQSGDSSTGHALYAIAERMGEKFSTDPGSSSHSTVNTKVLSYFNEAKFVLSFHDACVNNPDTYPGLRNIINKIVSQMTVPLVQSLIYYLRENDRDRVKLYAQAVVPLIAGCNPSSHALLREKLISSNFNVIETDMYISMIQSAYPCLGFTCEDVGAYQNGAQCKGAPVLNPMAGYVPMTDVRKIVTLDLDILHANIFMKKKAYGAVKDIYTFGKHSSVETLQGEELISFEQLARTSAREIVPSFNSFKRFFEDEFDNDANAKVYGHYILTRALDQGEMPMASQEQRREMVIKTLQYMVGNMGALQYMYEAVDDCESNDSGRRANAASKWDSGAALLIGSLEGTEEGGTEDGMMMHNLANKRCEQFGRCNSVGKAMANDELITLLYAGRGETESVNCPALKKTVSEVESLLQVGLVQGTLRYALANQEHQFFVKDKDLAEGYIFSRSILPYVSESDASAAETIAKNMDFSFVTKPVQGGARAVFNAFARSLPGMGVDCGKVGQAAGMDVCSVSTSTQSSAEGKRSVQILAAIIVSIASGFALL